MGHSHSQAWVRFGHHYQSNSSMAGDPISHGMTWVAGTRPLPIPRASTHSIRAAAAIVLGRRGRLRWRPATSERAALGRRPQSPWPPLTVLFLLLSSTTTRGKGGPGAIPGARRVVFWSQCPSLHKCARIRGSNLGAGVQKLASLDTITTVTLTAAARDLSQILIIVTARSPEWQGHPRPSLNGGPSVKPLNSPAGGLWGCNQHEHGSPHGG